jgi:hypothetical protein
VSICNVNNSAPISTFNETHVRVYVMQTTLLQYLLLTKHMFSKKTAAININNAKHPHPRHRGSRSPGDVRGRSYPLDSIHAIHPSLSSSARPVPSPDRSPSRRWSEDRCRRPELCCYPHATTPEGHASGGARWRPRRTVISVVVYY